MTKMSFFAAATAVAALTVAPAFAQDNAAKPQASTQIQSKQLKSSDKFSNKSSNESWKSSSRMSRNNDRMASQQRFGDRDNWNNNRGWNSAQRDDNAGWNNGRGWDNNNNARWDERRGWNESRADFWPGDVVGGAIGTAGAVTAAAVGTAGAIATAPFGGPQYNDSYAYDRGYDVSYNYNGTAIPYSASYAARNGFVCQPGSLIRSSNGQRTICQ